MEDGRTKDEAVNGLCNGTIVYEKEEFVKNFQDYIDDNQIDREYDKEYIEGLQKMTKTNIPINDYWGVVEHDNETYLINYCY